MVIVHNKRFATYVLMICMGIQPSVLEANPRPSVAGQQPAAEKRIRIVDVALDQRGKLSGAVYRITGKPLTKSKISLRSQDGRLLAEARTNRSGQFHFERLKGGVYQLATPSGVSFCRVWTKQAAPPSAANSILIVDDIQTARGQQPIRELFAADPVWVAGILAAAIAIPIAIHNARDDEDSGS